MAVETIRVLLVDDHIVVRQGLSALLETYDEIEVVGEAGSGAEGVDLATQLLPDVVLMDLVMPGMDGIEATRRVKIASPSTQVIVLTSYSEDERIFPAIKAGARSYLHNWDRPRRAGAADSDPHGAATLRQTVAARLTIELSGALRARLDGLPDREREVLAWATPRSLIGRSSVREQSTRVSATFYRSSIYKIAFRPHAKRCASGLSRRMRRTGRPTNAKISSYCQGGI